MKDIFVSSQEAMAAHDRVRRLAGEGNVEELIRELDNPTRFRFVIIRRSAAARLGELRAADAAEPVAKLLDDPVPQVRQAAARALGRIGVADDKIIGALTRRVERDDSEEVRGVAIASLGELGRVETYVRPYLNAPNASVRYPAMYALLLSDDPDARTAAKAQLQQERWYMWPYRRRLSKDLRQFRKHSRNDPTMR